MKNVEYDVVLSPTDKATNIINCGKKIEFIQNPQIPSTINSIVKGYYLNLTSKEDIKKGDWFIHRFWGLMQCSSVGPMGVVYSDSKSMCFGGVELEDISKIVMTSNLYLNLDRIPDNLIKQYCNKPYNKITLITEDPKTIKEFKDVEIGDIAFEHPDAGGEWNNDEGEIVWKGTFSELKQSKEYNYLIDTSDWEDDEDDFNIVIVDLDFYGLTVFGYDEDPSSVVCFNP